MSNSNPKNEYIQKLEFQSKLLKRAEQIAGLGHWRIDVLNNNELFWSDEIFNIHGVSKKDFVPTVEKAINFYHPDDVSTVQKLVQKAIEKGEDYSFDFRLVRPDGEIRHVVSSGECEIDDDGNVVAVFGVFNDITDIIEVQKRLAESNAELERYAYLASHDLQEPLRAVKSFSGLLKEEYSAKLDSTAQQYIDFSVQAVDRMYDLINDLLEYSRLDLGEESHEEVDLNVHLNDALENLKQLTDSIDAKVTYDRMPIVVANPLCVTSLFQNLIGNALKYRKKDVAPEIHIGVEDEKKYWRLSVSDNGIGMKEEYLDKIFGIFQRLHSKNEFSGTGIGLAICQKVINKMGGKIWVKSKIGEGSTFYFTIPKA